MYSGSRPTKSDIQDGMQTLSEHASRNAGHAASLHPAPVPLATPGVSIQQRESIQGAHIQTLTMLLPCTRCGCLLTRARTRSTSPNPDPPSSSHQVRLSIYEIAYGEHMSWRPLPLEEINPGFRSVRAHTYGVHVSRQGPCGVHVTQGRPCNPMSPI